MSRPVASSRFARGGVADDQLRLGQGQAVAHLVGLPPAVDQGRDPARLQDRHVGDDPGRAVAHRDRDPVALADPEAAGQRPGQPVGGRRSARRRSAARRRRSTASVAPWSAQKASNMPGRVGGRLVTIARPCSSRPIWIRPPAPITSASIASYLRSSSLGIRSPPFPFLSGPSYEGGAARGKP